MGEEGVGVCRVRLALFSWYVEVCGGKVAKREQDPGERWCAIPSRPRSHARIKPHPRVSSCTHNSGMQLHAIAEYQRSVAHRGQAKRPFTPQPCSAGKRRECGELTFVMHSVRQRGSALSWLYPGICRVLWRQTVVLWLRWERRGVG